MTRTTTRRATRRQIRVSRRRQLRIVGVIATIGLIVAGLLQAMSGVGAVPVVRGIYNAQQKPTIPMEADWLSAELGLRFRVSVPGSVVAIRFYKTERNAGPHTGHLWDASGKLLASVTFESEGKSGFQLAILKNPVVLQPNADYVVSYFSKLGVYSLDPGTFSKGKSIGNSIIWGTAGLYHYGTSPAFPKSSWRASSYYVDVLFRTTSSAGPVPSVGPVPSSDPTQTPAPPPSPQPTSTVGPPTPTTVPPTATPGPTSAPKTPVPPSSVGTSGTPGPSNTGVSSGTKLISVPGQQTSGNGWRWTGSAVQTTEPNAKLTGLDINGAVSNNFAGLTVTNTRIRCTNESQWCLSLGNQSTVSNTEIGGGADGSTYVSAIGVWTGGSTAGNVLRAINIHHTTDGMRVDGGTTLVDSYIHDLSMGQIPGAHSDGIQSTGGANVVINHNKIVSGNNCNVFLQWLSGNAAIGSYQILNNTFAAGSLGSEQTSYGVCAYSPEVSGVIVSGNVFSRGYEVTALTAPPGSTIGRNLYTDGAAVTTG